MRRTAALFSFTAVVALGAVSACGTSSPTSSSSGSGGSGGGLANCKGTITVATDLPLTGGDATDGPFPQMAAELAVDQANSNHTLGGCTLNYISKDDSSVAKNGHDPAQGAANIRALAADQSVVGVVGPFNSSVAEAEIPVASQNHLALISPSNTNPCLTVQGVPSSVCGIDTGSLYPGPHSYFRVIATDVAQGEIDAYVMAKVLNASKAYVFDDQEAYGAGLATIFIQHYQSDGGTVVGHASLPGTTTDFSTQISNAQSSGAQGLFFGGTSGNGCGLVRRDEGKGGLTVPYLGGDGCQDQKFITDANSGSNTSEAEGGMATSAPDVTKLSSSAAFYQAFDQAYANKPAPYNKGENEPYSPYGYDAMNILIQAIKSVLLQNGGQPPSDVQTFRDDVVAALRQTSYDGAIGHTSFDSNGDTTNTGFTLYKVSGGNWTTVNTYAVDTSGNVTVKS
jgi:branched-chain amino acid transport system substrate-binding protein